MLSDCFLQYSPNFFAFFFARIEEIANFAGEINKVSMEKKEKTIVGHIGVVGPRRLTRRKKQRVLSMEERDMLIAQAKAAYEIRINPTE